MQQNAFRFLHCCVLAISSNLKTYSMTISILFIIKSLYDDCNSKILYQVTIKLIIFDNIVFSCDSGRR